MMTAQLYTCSDFGLLFEIKTKKRWRGSFSCCNQARTGSTTEKIREQRES